MSVGVVIRSLLDFSSSFQPVHGTNRFQDYIIVFSAFFQRNLAGAIQCDVINADHDNTTFNLALLPEVLV